MEWQVKSWRKGPTGIGMRLKSLLDIVENNISLPDLDRIGIKSHSDSMKFMEL